VLTKKTKKRIFKKISRKKCRETQTQKQNISRKSCRSNETNA
jgi:hypothetical protein